MDRFKEKTGYIHVVPLPDNMPLVYAACDCVVVPSLRPEGFGLVTIEAMSMEKPVITTAHGASVSMVVPSETGWLVPPHDNEKLYDALQEVSRLSPEARQKMGRKGRERVEAFFSLDKTIKETADLYAFLANTTHNQNKKG